MAAVLSAGLLLAALLSTTAADFNLTILHTNDVHARYMQANAYGGACSREDAQKDLCFAGVARRYTEIKRLRQQNHNSLLLDAGDQYQGTFWFFVHKGNITAYFMNMLGYDAMALGNHEFDLGIGELAPFINDATFPVLSANINTSREPLLSGVSRYLSMTRGGRMIGIIGYTSVDTPLLTDAGSTATLTFMDEVAAVKQAAAELKQQGIDIIIALGHGGLDVDNRIAAEVEEVDVVVGGHTHSFLYTGVPPSNDVPVGPYPIVVRKPSGRTALVVQNFYFGKYLGHLDVVFDDNGNVVSWAGNPILLDKNVLQDLDVLKEVQRYGAVVDAEGKKVIGSSSVFLNGSREECRARECNLGNAIADAFVAAHVRPVAGEAPPDSLWGRSALAVINGGGIRVSITKGPILYEDILGTLPFQNTIDSVTLKGADVTAMFEQSVSHYDLQRMPGGFLQVSGFKVVYHMYKQPYSRVSSVHVRCVECAVPAYEPLDPARNYTVLMPAFMVAGGDNYTVVRDRLIGHEILGQVDSDIFIAYVKAKSPLVNGLEDRLRLVFSPSPDESPQKTCGCHSSLRATSPVVMALLLLLAAAAKVCAL